MLRGYRDRPFCPWFFLLLKPSRRLGETYLSRQLGSESRELPFLR
jgi:hypothetical protein